jgi:glucan phosphorylase
MKDSELGAKFVFVKDYEINVGRHLVRGVDVWLNNPYRPLEASGTSGQNQRDKDGLARGWIKRMKRTIRTLGWHFSANRVVMDYTQKGYIPAAGGTSS